MMLTNSESGRKCPTQIYFKIFKFKFFSGLAGVLAAFPLAFAKKMFGLNLKSANTKTAGANKVLKSRKGVHNIAFDQC